MVAPIFATAQRPPLPLNIAHFIARRILVDKDRADRFSRPIVGIAVLGIIIGMAVMVITVGITSGFQREVRSKVTGAGGHLQILSIGQTDMKETPRVLIAQPFYPSLDTVNGVKHIQVFATRPGIIETEQEIQGVVLKGVGHDHDWEFLQKHLKGGVVPAIGDSTRPIDLLLSTYLANRLRIGVTDTITVYLIKDNDDVRPRKFRVSGLYETGVESLDHQLVYVDIAHLQRFAQWGLKAEVLVSDTLDRGRVKVEALAFGGDRVYSYEWPDLGISGRGPHWIPFRERITLVVKDAEGTIPDTAWVDLAPMEAVIGMGGERAVPRVKVRARGGSGGSNADYCGGFEVILDRFEDLGRLDDLIYRDHLDNRLRSISVKQRFPEIFAWLALLDTNVVVIIVLMVIVAIINMTSALLIIILERTPMIGVLKALGTSTGTIRRIFLIDAAYILGAGIILGDMLGVVICMAQQQFGIITLPVESYYVDAVPVDLDVLPVVLLNLGTLAVCVLALTLPSLLVARIAPARAIRFA